MPSLDKKLLEKLEFLAGKYIESKSSYSSLEYIDSGGSAAVYKVDTPNGLRALKVCNPELLTGDTRVAEENRINLQKRLIGTKSEFVAETFNIEINETCIIEMEYLPWPSLKSQLKSIKDDHVQPLILQLVDGIKYLESLGLVHRDIKPENILISPDVKSLKLIDFGVIRDISAYDDHSDHTDHGLRKPFLATAQYSSPEYLFRLIEPSQELWKGLTIYQVGAVLHDLLTKNQIFEEEVASGNRFVLAMAVLRKRPSLDAATNPELNQLKILARNCLTKNLNLRLALVNWDDFDFTPETNLMRLRKQLHQRKQLTDIIGSNDAKSTKELNFKQHQILQSIYDSIKTNLLQVLGQFIKIEGISPKSDSNEFHIKICYDTSLKNIWMKVYLEWDESEDAPDTASVFMHTRLDDDATPNLWIGSPKLVGTVDITGIGQSELINVLSEELATIIQQIISV